MAGAISVLPKRVTQRRAKRCTSTCWIVSSSTNLRARRVRKHSTWIWVDDRATSNERSERRLRGARPSYPESSPSEFRREFAVPRPTATESMAPVGAERAHR